jgi:hypothetical protein
MTAIDWSTLEDICGSAENIPDLLEELEATKDPEILDELWNRLYHQGSVYSASFAAVPYLIRIAEQWPPSDRLSILHLAVSILTGEDDDNLVRLYNSFRTEEVRDTWKTTSDRIALNSPTRINYQSEIDALLRLTAENLQELDLSEQDFTYLLIWRVALQGDLLWSQALECFALCAIYGDCDRCGATIDICINQDSGVAEIETRNGQKHQTTLQPPQPEELTGIARSPYETARDRGYDLLATRIIYILSTGTCPQCGASFRVPELLQFPGTID